MQLKNKSTFVPIKEKKYIYIKSLGKINDITLLINFSHRGRGLCRNYALQREEMGMLVMCEPLVWFCINFKKKKESVSEVKQ